MRRRGASDLSSEGSFDSFLSTVTKNGLGMLVLVAMASTFSSQLTLGQAKFKQDLGTPLLKPAPVGLRPEYFECRGNRVFPVELSFLQPDVDRFFKFALSPEQKQQVVQELNALKRTNDFHRFVFEPDFNRLKVHLRAREGPGGFSLEDLKAPDSAFGKYLTRLSAHERYLFFDVRADSFPAFREARAFAKAKGFQIGWEPMPADREFSFTYGVGPGGALPGIDQ